MAPATMAFATNGMSVRGEISPSIVPAASSMRVEAELSAIPRRPLTPTASTPVLSHGDRCPHTTPSHTHRAHRPLLFAARVRARSESNLTIYLDATGIGTALLAELRQRT